MPFLTEKVSRHTPDRAGDRYKDYAVGIEVEVEGDNLPNPVRGWKAEADGSLRGNSIEYVTKTPPKKPEEAAGTLQVLRDEMTRVGSDIHDSPRCGVHIHLNCNHWTIQQMFTFACLYYVLEEAIINRCGDGRAGNLFCLRVRDAEYISAAIIQSLELGTLKPVCNEGMRYAALNFDSIRKYGSLEFRALRTPTNVMDIEKWVDLLVTLQKSSVAFNSPADIVELFSAEGASNFVKSVLPPKHATLITGQAGFEQMMQEGVWMVQDIAYTTKWS